MKFVCPLCHTRFGHGIVTFQTDDVNEYFTHLQEVHLTTAKNLDSMIYQFLEQHIERGIWSFERLRKMVYKAYVKNGFLDYWNNVEPFEIGIIAEIALVDTEIAEGIDAIRDKNYKELETEIADRIIRCLNLGTRLHLNLEKAIFEKHMKNMLRPKKHGRKVI